MCYIRVNKHKPKKKVQNEDSEGTSFEEDDEVSKEKALKKKKVEIKCVCVAQRT